jgi:hypothetical protein
MTCCALFLLNSASSLAVAGFGEEAGRLEALEATCRVGKVKWSKEKQG